MSCSHDQICGWFSNEDRDKYIAWIHLMMSLSYDVVTICIKIIYCRLFLAQMDEDCRLDTWMIIQSCIVEDMMMMSSYLYDDRLFRTYADIPKWWSWWLWCFSHRMWKFYWCGHTLMIHALMQVAGLVVVDRYYEADHTMLLLIMILFRCLVFVINVMYITRCKGHIKTHDVIVCLYLL